MRSHILGGLAAVACAATIAACSDDSKGTAFDPTEPLASPLALRDGVSLRVGGTSSITRSTPGGVETTSLRPWTAAGMVRAGIARDDDAASPLGILAVTRAMRGGVPATGGTHTSSFVDDGGNRVEVAWVFASDAGPLRAVRFSVNGELRMVTDFRWAPSGGGWVLRSSTRQLYRDGVPAIAINGAVTEADMAQGRGIAGDLALAVALGGARLLAPQDAAAQILSGPCRQEWLNYVAAEAALSGALVAFERFPSPVTAAAVIAASAKATQAEMALWLCQENDYARKHPIGGPGAGTPEGPCTPEYWTPICDDNPSDFQ